MTNDKQPEHQLKAGTRKPIGLLDTDPESTTSTPDDLPESLKALRQATITRFRSAQVRSFIEEQIEYVNLNRQVAEAIQFFFDEKGRLPANAPIHEIIAERKKIESSIRWFEAICKELTNELAQIKEIEDAFLDYLSSQEE
ncbi:hypothetical protein GF1_03020 [Desulfolithobacter dissulfuricans]|uniref:Uncharacterized protein n=1 Tax=Desulfolithobacter dissulfuricans TaxID=2795293 RepID=A0A915U8E7_9BACT|nr:hypothetical protein [Desulfolithobacter dissulfuricans]BCO07926.1 hypothetical protein GF1_03020 [Desulfolithobacter dissulfuricans]